MRQKQPIPGSIVAPKFATEAEEAEWWFRDRRIHDKTFHEAVKSGRAQTLSKEKLLERIAAAKKKTASPVLASGFEDLTRPATVKSTALTTFFRNRSVDATSRASPPTRSRAR